MRRNIAVVKPGQRDRCKRILALVPEIKADSEGSNGSSDEEAVNSCQSSPPPSIESSLERLNLLDSLISSDCNSPTQSSPSLLRTELNNRESSSPKCCGPVSDDQPPLTPILKTVFPFNAECDFNAIPSISSLNSLPSNQPSPLPSTSQSTSTRNQRKRKVPAIIAKKVKVPRTQRPKLTFQWTKRKFQYPAELPDSCFEEAVPINWSALDYFYRFFPEKLIEDIAVQTNLYSVQKTGRSIKVTVEDIKKFLAINIMMGVVVMPSYKDYWKTSYRYPKIADVMPIKRFQLIRRFIHFADNTQADEIDRYYKLRPLLDCVRTQCQSIEEENAFSIDEMIIPYKGKKAGSRRQYNPNKPYKWGFKNLVRAGVSGLIYDFILYAGDDTFRDVQFDPKEECLGVGAKTVLALCKSIKKRPCVVYFDNWFTTLELIHLLRHDYGIFSLETVRKNRLKDANELLLSDKALQKKGRGAHCQVTCNKNKVAIVKWYDNKPVSLVSSYIDSFPVDKIRRFSKESRTHVDIPCPQIVKDYNKHMGGVDVADMLIALYRTSMKTHRWYLNIFSQIIDICVNNGWLLRRRHYKSSNIKKKEDHLKQFRYEVYAALIKKDRQIATTVQDSVPEEKKIKKPAAERPIDAIRYDCIDHWPAHTEYQRCKYCKKGQASTRCTKCNVHLCYVAKRNCFLAYHKQ